MIENPILKGFNPDPSVIRVKKKYYIATSTFEWWPGVCIHSSEDLKNWKIDQYPLNSKSKLDLSGVPNGGGIWAPCLSYDGKTIYLVYTNVRERGQMMVTDNYLVYTNDIEGGEWSEPIYLNSMGFDPSLFHDEDGKKYLLSLDNNYEEGKRFNGLWLQEYDHGKKCMIGKPTLIYKEPSGELVEGSHILRHNGMYYLLKAQGGTGERHSAQMSRSQNLYGPYEDDKKILLHARDDNSLYIRKAGHADLVETPYGELYLVYLGVRYSKMSEMTTYFGRETCIDKVYWSEDGWLRLKNEKNTPSRFVEDPKNTKEVPYPKKSFFDFRGAKELDMDFMTLRGPIDSRLEFTDEGLVIKGGDGLMSRFDQSLIAHRITERKTDIQTGVSFYPECSKHHAGIIICYDTDHWHYLYVSRDDETQNKKLCTLSADKGKLIYSKETVILPENVDITLYAHIDENDLQFGYSVDGEEHLIGEVKDMHIVTDENIYLGFCGAMAGICVSDMFMKKKSATYRYFKIESKEMEQGND